MTKRKKDKYICIQMEDGKWYRVKGYTHTECCDCALIHVEQYRLVDGQLEWMAVRDDKKTEARRKELGIKVVNDAKSSK
jgi:Zn-finger protein